MNSCISLGRQQGCMLIYGTKHVDMELRSADVLRLRVCRVLGTLLAEELSVDPLLLCRGLATESL